MAVGAQRVDMARLVVRQGLTMPLARAALDSFTAWGLSRLLQQLTFGVTALDPLTMIAAPLVLLVVAVMASLIPSWMASKADPVAALRQN